MSFDLSRVRFDARKDFLGVIMQQGRVQLDADWNEWVTQLVRRIQAGTLDTIGAAAVPSETAAGFSIEVTDGEITIGQGRIYVDGLLAENHGEGRDGWDRRLAEEFGSSRTRFFAQPYLPFNETNADKPAASVFDRPTWRSGSHLVYVDVWQRDVTHLQEPGLVEQAVGVDTTGRVQTVWQVKVLKDVGDVTPDTDEKLIPGWSALTRPSGGRLSTSTGEPPINPGPCDVPPTHGYRGSENQTYRVEIHRGGPVGEATFKWSRDNATVATRITRFDSLRKFQVESVGRDGVLRFNDGDWVEITDDWHELHNLPGELAHIAVGNGVDDDTKTITLENDLPDGAFPKDAVRHVRVRRWDQAGEIFKEDGTKYVNVDDDPRRGEILVPPAGTKLFLENGILVDFAVVGGEDGSEGKFRTGDFWVFCARNADGTVGPLDRSPPLGIHHHYARLAILTSPNEVDDCRTLWPPRCEGERCDCSVCVSPETHASGRLTIQAAVNLVKGTGGTVCLGAGTYQIGDTVRIENAKSILIRGKGLATQIVMTRPGPALRIADSEGVRLESLKVVAPAGGSSEGVVAVSGVVDAELRQCEFVSMAGAKGAGTAVSLAKIVALLDVRDCIFGGATGLGSVQGRADDYLATVGLTVEDNLFACSEVGISLGPKSIFGETRIAGNILTRTGVPANENIGMICSGAVPSGKMVHIRGNTVDGGIVVGVSGARIYDNDLNSKWLPGNGITLVAGPNVSGLTDCHIVGNRISGMRGHGIAVQTAVDAILVKNNVIQNVGRAGVLAQGAGVGAEASVGHFVMEGNELLRILGATDDNSRDFVGMQFVGLERLEVLDNRLRGFGEKSLGSTGTRAAIEVIACRYVRISGNSLSGIGPAKETKGNTAAILLYNMLCHDVDIVGNQVTRALDPGDTLGLARWRALHVREAQTIGKGLAWVSLAKFNVLISAHVLATFRNAKEEDSRRTLAVRGNSFEASATFAPVVEIDAAGMCSITDNRCRLVYEGGEIRPAVVAVRHVPASITANCILGSVRGSAEPEELELDALRLEPLNATHITVVGNLVSGPIKVFGVPIGPPWAELNPMVSYE